MLPALHVAQPTPQPAWLTPGAGVLSKVRQLDPSRHKTWGQAAEATPWSSFHPLGFSTIAPEASTGESVPWARETSRRPVTLRAQQAGPGFAWLSEYWTPPALGPVQLWLFRNWRRDLIDLCHELCFQIFKRSFGFMCSNNSLWETVCCNSCFLFLILAII